MSRYFRGAAAVLVVVICAASYARADDKDQIKETARSFAEALRSGDAPTAHKYAITDERSSKFLDTMAAITKANKKMTEAAVAKFGDAGKTFMSGNAMAMHSQQFAKELNEADIQVNGDTATIASKGGRGQPLKLKKDGGKWKVDFTELPNADQIQRGLPMMDKMVGVMNETGDDINAGKYKTIQEAQQGFRMKMAATMGAGAPNAPQPKP